MDVLLVLNAGSSSIKFSVFAAEPQPELLFKGQLSGLLSDPQFVATDAQGDEVGQNRWPSPSELSHLEAIDYLLNWIRDKTAGNQLLAVGHRVVHGGNGFHRPVVVDSAVMQQLQAFVPWAPLHQAHNLAAIRSASELMPGLPQIACFDTAFHRSQPEVAQMYALPGRLSHLGLRRHGFHGLSYEYVASRMEALEPTTSRGRVIVAHLGNGCSLCAMRDGRSLATTMGFSTLEGLPMGTRCGAIDPGVLLYLLDHQSFSVRQLEHLLYHESGLLGLSGVSSDMRRLLEQESQDSQVAAAIEYFIYRVHREIGSLVAALGGLDCIVFTAGIGENSATVRARICQSAGWLGIQLDPVANQKHGPRISQANSAVSVWVVPTHEELVIAKHVLDLIA